MIKAPSISKEEYQKRRDTFLEKMVDNSIAFIMGNDEVTRSHDTSYPFRQDSHFYYLTGFDEPQAALVLIKGNNNHSIIFNQAKDLSKEQWQGWRLGVMDAPKSLGVNEAFEFSAFFDKVPELISNKKSVYYSFARHQKLDDCIKDSIADLKTKNRKGLNTPIMMHNAEPIIDEMRVIKSEAEIEVMRYVAKASASAHKKAMKGAKNANYEYQLEGLLKAELSQFGIRHMAYDAIVASGENACILHYTKNNKAYQKGDLILIDAGGEYLNYAADITRTFPADAKFSDAQKAIYQLVLKAQKAGIEIIKPGLLENEVQKVIVDVLVEGLIELNLLKGEKEKLIEEKAHMPFYMHGSGHYLGIDVHDVGVYKINDTPRALEKGMVLTVEPGIYILPSLDVPDAFKGIGIRIEDDIVVTDTGYDILSKDVPKEISEIEQLINDGE